ncbi:MAG TPA: 2-C-methyl-D-erythritol 2,4-cyclodiphosphate synthase [Thermoanaerobaculia bacterium]|nr:2-C-methyl-D-erythritol 2,4-cyclodiphosphate synthase [Thermoanaerobaculia bacterium]
MRIGQGIDVHPFETERPLILGVVRISETDGLAGQSDADAVLHAITDALLGALGVGDIGAFFPSDDARWEGADSAIFVREALGFVTRRGYGIANLDVTVVAERPRLAPHRDRIRESIASILSIEADRVSVKATTTDHLGFLGRGEGLAAFAVVLVESR